MSASAEGETSLGRRCTDPVKGRKKNQQGNKSIPAVWCRNNAVSARSCPLQPFCVCTPMQWPAPPGTPTSLLASPCSLKSALPAPQPHCFSVFYKFKWIYISVMRATWCGFAWLLCDRVTSFVWISPMSYFGGKFESALLSTALS